MTEREAIEILKGDFSKVTLSENESHSDVFTEAFNMAIKALEADVPDTDVGKMGSMVEKVTDIITQVKEDICNNYCKYTAECWDRLDNGEETRPCPLNRL